VAPLLVGVGSAAFTGGVVAADSPGATVVWAGAAEHALKINITRNSVIDIRMRIFITPSKFVDWITIDYSESPGGKT
jgi:hypothetical protein